MHVCAGTVLYMSRAVKDCTGCRCNARLITTLEAPEGHQKWGDPGVTPIWGIMSWKIWLLYIHDSPPKQSVQQQCGAQDGRLTLGGQSLISGSVRGWKVRVNARPLQGGGHRGHTVVKTFKSAASSPSQNKEPRGTRAKPTAELSCLHTHMLAPQAAWRYIAVNGGKNVWVLDSFFPPLTLCSTHRLCSKMHKCLCSVWQRSIWMTLYHMGNRQCTCPLMGSSVFWGLWSIRMSYTMLL